MPIGIPPISPTLAISPIRTISDQRGVRALVEAGLLEYDDTHGCDLSSILRILAPKTS